MGWCVWQVRALDEDNTRYKQANRSLQRRLQEVLCSTEAAETDDGAPTTNAAVREQELRAFNAELQRELGNLRAFVHATSGTVRVSRASVRELAIPTSRPPSARPQSAGAPYRYTSLSGPLCTFVLLLATSFLTPYLSVWRQQALTYRGEGRMLRSAQHSLVHFAVAQCDEGVARCDDGLPAIRRVSPLRLLSRAIIGEYSRGVYVA